MQDSYRCSQCGHQTTEGECVIVELDPNSEWWLSLFDGPYYCQECAAERQRKEKE